MSIIVPIVIAWFLLTGAALYFLRKERREDQTKR
jgi:hypothetical protein